MKLFIDSANLDEIRTANSWGIIDGVTTNPTLVSKEKRGFKDLVNEICTIVDGPISVEVVSLDEGGMVTEAQELSQIHANIVIKIPMTDEGLKAVKTLRKDGIKTNVTLVFSPTQALLAAKAGASYVSPFIGRLDDISHIGMEIVDDIVTIFENYGFDTEVIVASVRNPLHILDAARIGASIATAPFKVLEVLLKHPLTDIGIDKFMQDWKKVPKG